ncbi:MAG: 50S ribosomal protein L9 [Bacteroidaceae bacterium]|nr:50S ribosomal protein L9 [Bacteroidaceae bacterium]
MEVILKQDVANLGYKDDVVKVKDGYGRNYLIPQGLAIVATESAKKVLAENQRQRAHKIAKMHDDAEALGKKIENVALTLKVKVNESGTIFGGINGAQIADELAKLGYEVDRKSIKVDNVKELGSYKASVTLFRDVKVEIPFEVVAETGEPAAE